MKVIDFQDENNNYFSLFLIVLKDRGVRTVTPIFFFFIKVSPGPSRHTQMQYRMLSNIRGLIRVRNRITSG
jgi:hypothetical protein